MSTRTADAFSEKTKIAELKWSFEYFSASTVKWPRCTDAGVEIAVANSKSIDENGGCGKRHVQIGKKRAELSYIRIK